MVYERNYFPKDFFHSRERFLFESGLLNAKIDSFILPHKLGAFDDPLSIDIALIGNPAASKKVISIAGIHGVEGFLGSAIQFAILKRMGQKGGDTIAHDDCAAIFVHCLNPWGMAMGRRVNENNVDLNRNCVFLPDTRHGAPDGYSGARALLMPDSLPSFLGFSVKALIQVAIVGYRAFRQSITGGQYVDPEGIFFGGGEVQQEIAIFGEWIQNNIRATDHVVTIDIHSGLGGFCEDSLLIDDPDGSESHKRVVSIFNNEKIYAPDSSNSLTYVTRGSLSYLIPKIHPNIRVDQVVHEFGTVSPLKVIYSLVEENYLYFKDPSRRFKGKLVNVFCPTSQKWRENGVRRGVAVFEKAVSSIV
jgi:hypothetical protein